jgi:hypothetical protein
LVYEAQDWRSFSSAAVQDAHHHLDGAFGVAVRHAFDGFAGSNARAGWELYASWQDAVVVAEERARCFKE